MDDSWAENVGPLLNALEDVGIDPVEWARDPDMGVFYQDGCKACGWHPSLKGKMDKDSIEFAMGYLQATGNLTNVTWAEQIEDFLRKEKDDAD